jgi:hypothetical protein
MSTEAAILAALLLAIPIFLKYILAFETRTMVARIKRQERQLDSLASRLVAVGREHDVVRGALVQVHEQQRWACTRTELVREELLRVRAAARSSALPEDELLATAAEAGA